MNPSETTWQWTTIAKKRNKPEHIKGSWLLHDYLSGLTSSEQHRQQCIKYVNGLNDSEIVREIKEKLNEPDTIHHQPLIF